MAIAPREHMLPVLILYATREGQTRRIAEHLAAAIRAADWGADALDVRELPGDFDLGKYSAAVLAASIHLGKHEREMIAFVRERRSALEAMPAAFLSISLSEAGAEMETNAHDVRLQAARDVQRLIDEFFEQTGWHPARVKPVAGALAYTKYNALVRLVMKHIAKKEGGSTDTHHDHEYTDWVALDQFVVEFLSAVKNN